MNNRTKEDYASLFIDKYLTNEKNLPYKVVTSRYCPDGNRTCNKHHGEVTVESYNKKNNDFSVSLYGIHESKPTYQTIWEPKLVKNLVLKSMRKRLFNTKDLKKKLDLSSVFRTELLQTRVTIDEKKIIEDIAISKNMSVSEYLRKQALL